MIEYCNRGHEYTPENTYWRRGGQKRECRICRRTERRSSKEYRAAYKAKVTYKSYGITLEGAAELKSKGCEICGTIEERMTIDHDHKTGKVRGALCYKCNLVLGHVDDNVDTLSAFITYLLKHKHINV